jgi:RHS repeat-associated protein
MTRDVNPHSRAGAPRSQRYALAFALLVVSLPAVAQQCDADMAAPYSGWSGGSSAWDIAMYGGWDQAQDLESLLQRWESRTLNSWAALGWPASLARTSQTGSQQIWTLTIERPWWYNPQTYTNYGAYAAYTQTSVCPSGYERHWGNYGGTNQYYCTLANVNLQTCPTAVKPDKSRGSCGNPMEGNPCNVATGNKYQLEVDFAGSGPFPLRFERHYNSDLDTPSSTLGPQWRHTFDRKIVFSDHSSVSSIHTGPLEAFVYRPDGKVIVFQIDGTTVTPRDTDTTATLTKLSGSSWEYTGSDDVAELYRIANEGGEFIGRLATLTSRGGHTLTLEYSADRVETVTDDFSRQISFTYASGRLATMTDPNGEEYAYSYDTNGNLSEIAYPDETPGSPTDNPTRQYLYEDSSHAAALTSITNENGDVHGSWEYDNSRRAISSERDGGFNRLDFTYHGNGTTTVVEDGGETKLYAFDTVQNVRRPITVTSSGVAEVTAYDANGFLESHTDKNSVQTGYTFDSRGLEIERIEAAGTSEERVTETEWHSTFRVPIRISVGAKETAFAYDTAGRLISSTVTDTQTLEERTTTVTYSTTGLPETIDGPRTNATDVATMAYIGGDLATFTNSAGHVSTFDSYDTVGRLLQMTDANGLVTAYAYNPRGWLSAITQTPIVGAPRVTSYEYDDLGQLTKVELPNGMELTYAYTPARYLESVADNLGNYIELTYDSRGNREEAAAYDSSDTLKRSMAWVYDAKSRIEAVNNAGSWTEFEYDNEGNLESEEDPNDNVAMFSYDPLERLAEVLDALSTVTIYAYDEQDLLTSVEAPNGATTAYTYNAFGDLLSTASPDTGTTTYSYDDAGNMVSRTDANSDTVSYAYDTLNRLTTIDYPGSSLDVTLTYDQGTGQVGRLTAISDGSGGTSLEYDAFGNLLEETKTIAGNVHVTSYTYDEADLITSITYPSGRIVNVTRNVLGQVTTVATTYGGSTATVASNGSYEPFGPLKSLTFGNSLVLSRVYDQQYRLTDQTTGSVQDVAFTLDAAGNIDAIVDGVNTALSQGFGQDVLNRMTTDAGSYGSKTFTYDGAGNRLTRTFGGTTQVLTYTANSNRLATQDGQTVTHSAAGQVLSNVAQGATFTYGAHARMVTASVGGVLKASYVYDARGQRVKKVEATGAQRTVIYHYGFTGELLGETIYNSAGSKIGERDYIWLDSLPLAQSERVFTGGSIASSAFLYLHADHLKTPRLATNASGTVVWRWDSDGFGIGAANQDPDGDTNLANVRLRFPGQYLDEETGLHYNYQRDYDPTIGRYVESDPIGLGGGLNTFGYANAQPLRWTDPFGLYIPAATENCFPNILSDHTRDTEKVTSVPGPIEVSRWVIPVVIPSLSFNPRRPREIGPDSPGSVLITTTYRDIWEHQMLERSVNYTYICLNECGEIESEDFGQHHEPVLGPRGRRIEREILDRTFEWIEGPLPGPFPPLGRP